MLRVGILTFLVREGQLTGQRFANGRGDGHFDQEFDLVHRKVHRLVNAAPSPLLGVPNVAATHEPTPITEAPLPQVRDSPRTTTSSPTYVIRNPYELILVPFVDIGVHSVRGGPKRDPPSGHYSVCPANRAYCIDYKASDNGTCMYPSPVEVKQCYDSSCVQSSWGPIVRRQQGEDTYCKDFMTSQGRLCQWVDSLPCTCNSKSIWYYDAEFIPNDQPVPSGFTRAEICTYPLDLIRKAAEEAALRALEKRNNRTTRRPRRRQPDQKDATETNDDEGSEETRERAKINQSDNDDKHGGLVGMNMLVVAVLAALCV